MADALTKQNMQNAFGVQGSAESQEGSRLLRQNRQAEDITNLGASASSSLMQNLGTLQDARQTFAGSSQYSKALDFGKKSVWDKYKLQFDTMSRGNEDARIKEITDAYSSASDFKASAEEIEAQIQGLR